jgi:hypothetical protein
MGADGSPIVVCKQLTRAEQESITRNQQLMISPEKLLMRLSDVAMSQRPEAARAGNPPDPCDDDEERRGQLRSPGVPAIAAAPGKGTR